MSGAPQDPTTALLATLSDLDRDGTLEVVYEVDTDGDPDLPLEAAILRWRAAGRPLSTPAPMPAEQALTLAEWWLLRLARLLPLWPLALDGSRVLIVAPSLRLLAVIEPQPGGGWVRVDGERPGPSPAWATPELLAAHLMDPGSASAVRGLLRVGT